MWKLLVVVLALVPGLPAFGLERLDGYFVATDACEAYQSKNNLSNPGGIRTMPYRAYEMLAVNVPGGDYYQMRMLGAPVTTERWVPSHCGVHVVSALDDGPLPIPVDETAAASGAMLSDRQESVANILALSWQPAFCEQRPGRTECRTLNAGQMPLAEIQFSLHGLWPQPKGKSYCGVPDDLVAADRAGRWQDLPEVGIDRATRNALAVTMPGVASALDRHQWIKHGTCFGGEGGADAYFDDALEITGRINQSDVAFFVARLLGEEVRTSEIRDRFDEAFGPGAGARVEFECRNDGARTLLQEIRIHLAGEISPGVSPGALMRAADPAPIGCRKGIIDIFGLQ